MKSAGLRYLKNVSTLQFDETRCIGCGVCADVCPHGVFVIRDSLAQIVERDACIECGGCALNCPAEVLQVKAGVGCASAIIKGWLTGSEPNCDCSNDSGCC
ncbi:MAG: mercury methylation ferredoxin HgcB [Desulfuromonadales bacterium]|nr:mercury methylation ferredoxin HgcB [Desulfuromonadales bacterium]